MSEKRSMKRGFTLVEILVSMGIAGILMIFLLSLVGAGADGYAMANRDVRSRTEGRGALHFFERDFDSRVPGRALTREDDRDGSAFPSDALGFLCFKSAAAQDLTKNGGEICFARYYTAVTADGAGQVSRKLFRQFVSSADVFLQVPEDPAQAYPAPVPNDKRDEVIALNVLQFELKYLARGPSGTWLEAENWDAVQSALPAAEREAFSASLMEVTLRVVDHETARRLRTAVDWDDPSVFGTAAAPREEAAVSIFKTQIPLR